MSRGQLVPGWPTVSGYSVIGEKSISVLIGEYRTIFTTSVTVFWGFDENSKLIDIYVWKVNDVW